MHIEKLNHGLYEVKLENVSFLGIQIGTKAGRAASRIAAIAQNSALLVGPDEGPIGTWHISGTAVHQEELLVYGPWLGGVKPLSAFDSIPRADAMMRLQDLIKVFQKLDQARSIPSSGLFPGAIIALDDGRFLILPAELQKNMLSMTHVQERAASFDSFHRTGLSGIQDLIFGIDVLAFRIMTGNLPYENVDDPALLGAWQLAGVMKTPRCLVTSVPDAVETYFQRRFQGKKGDTGNLAETLQILRTWMEASNNSGSGHDPDSQALQAYLARQESFKRRYFVRKHSLPLTLGAIGLGILIIIGSTVIGNVLKPPRTAGMNARQVVEAYYGSLNSLDVELIKDAVRNGVGQDLVSLADNLFVISQVRMGTERRNVRMPVNEWQKAGQPPLESGLMLFGIADLKIQDEPGKLDTADMAKFIVSYEICTSAPKETGQGMPSGMVAEFQPRTDAVTVMPNGKQGAWIITGIVRLQEGSLRSVEVPLRPATGTIQ